MYSFVCVYARRLLLICIFILKLLFISTSPLRSHCALPCRWVAVLSTSPAMANTAACASKIVGQVCRWFGALKEFLSAEGISLQFVFVSACYSKAIGEAFVKAGVPHVVCVKVDSQVDIMHYMNCIINVYVCVYMLYCRSKMTLRLLSQEHFMSRSFPEDLSWPPSASQRRPWRTRLT